MTQTYLRHSTGCVDTAIQKFGRVDPLVTSGPNQSARRKGDSFMKNIESKQPSSDTGHIFGIQNDYTKMFQMILGFNVSQIVHTAALYSLAEHLAQDRQRWQRSRKPSPSTLMPPFA
jgi:hypothetical protein